MHYQHNSGSQYGYVNHENLQSRIQILRCSQGRILSFKFAASDFDLRSTKDSLSLIFRFLLSFAYHLAETLQLN